MTILRTLFMTVTLSKEEGEWHCMISLEVKYQSKVRSEFFICFFYIQHYLFAFVCVNSTVLFYLLVSFSIQEFIPLKLLVVDIILLKQTVTFKMAAEFWQTGCAEIILSRCSKACLRGSRIAVNIKDVILTVKHLRWPSLLFINRCGSWWKSVAFCRWAVQPWFSNTCCFSGSWLLHLWTNCFSSVVMNANPFLDEIQICKEKLFQIIILV